jgi:hypothetical protein
MVGGDVWFGFLLPFSKFVRHFCDTNARAKACVYRHFSSMKNLLFWSSPDYFYKGRSQEKTQLQRPEFFLLRSPPD